VLVPNSITKNLDYKVLKFGKKKIRTKKKLELDLELEPAPKPILHVFYFFIFFKFYFFKVFSSSKLRVIHVVNLREKNSRF
jgi:hypothetical protein